MAITINLYLDTRFAKKTEPGLDREYPVKVTITKDGATSYLSTGVRLTENQWKDRHVTGRKDKARLNDYLESIKSRVRCLIHDGLEEERYQFMTATEIKNDISKRMGQEVRWKNKSALFHSVFDKFAESRNSERTKEIYRVTGRKIRHLFPDADRIRLEQVDLDWLDNLNELLTIRGNNGTTRNIDLRNIRAVVKYAQRHKLLDNNPFEDFIMPAGESPDRALTIEQLRTLTHVDVEPWERKYLDFFLLSFLLIGMNTEDLLHMEKIEDGRINYVRAKTNKPISVKVPDEALEIIERYKGKKYLLNVLDTYASTHNWTAKVDANLKAIDRRNGLPDITMYWARHTWATVANADLGIDISTIADALGHQPEKRVTLLYIRRKDYSAVDAANRKVIDYLYFDSQLVEDSD